jgi:hypothetical protein
MTIEQEFFKAFGVGKQINKTKANESIKNCSQPCVAYGYNDFNCWECRAKFFNEYPSITPEIVLKLIEIIINKKKWFLTKDILDDTKFNWRRFDDNLWSEASGNLKDCTLYLFLTFEEKERLEIQDQVRALFKNNL